MSPNYIYTPIFIDLIDITILLWQPISLKGGQQIEREGYKIQGHAVVSHGCVELKTGGKLHKYLANVKRNQTCFIESSLDIEDYQKDKEKWFLVQLQEFREGTKAL